MQTVEAVIVQFIESLCTLYDERESQHIAHLALEHVLGIGRLTLNAQKNVTLSIPSQQQLHLILHRLTTGEPIQYILGEAHFYGLKFKVTPATFIPRPETEELTEWIIREYRSVSTPSILDVGTGSGCIAVVLKLHLQQSTVTATDISPDALLVAKENAQRHKVQINFLREDILSVNTHNSYSKYDCIVSNPPYVLYSEAPTLHCNVRNYEPEQALFVPDSNPMLYYEALIRFASTALKPAGRIFLEIHEQRGKEVVHLLDQIGFHHIRVRKDLSGKARMVSAQSPVIGLEN